MTDRKANVGRGRWALLLIFGLFMLPIVVAWILNFGTKGWKPEQTTNYGQLVIPVRPLPAVPLAGPGGAFLPDDFLNQKWTLVYLEAGECTDLCQQSLYKMRQVRLAQGRNLDRVQRLVVVTDQGADAIAKDVLAAWPGLVIAQPIGERAGEFLEQFQLPTGAPSVPKGWIYLIDPFGNLMMSYQSDAEPSGMRKDLEHLLKWSVGD